MFIVSKVCISQKVKGDIMRNQRDTIFYTNTSALQDFHVCISVPLIPAAMKKQIFSLK